MSRVAVVGVGAIGGVFGVRLCRSKAHEVTLCAREPIERLVVETPAGVLEADVRCATDPGEVEHVDWSICVHRSQSATAVSRSVAASASSRSAARCSDCARSRASDALAAAFSAASRRLRLPSESRDALISASSRPNASRKSGGGPAANSAAKVRWAAR